MINRIKRFIRILKEGYLYTKLTSFPPGHYYSPILNQFEYKNNNFKFWSELGDIKLNSEKQNEVLSAIQIYFQDFPNLLTVKKRYDFNNDWYPYLDAKVLYSLIRFYRPQNIIEVGSGYSSALILDVNETYFENKIELTFIEPNPNRLIKLLYEKDWETTSILKEIVQNIDLEKFKSLNENDILLIDSSHVSKSNSDVNFLFFHVFPVLKPGVIIHIHDVFFPFEYPEEWIKSGKDWNESYLLRAFLQNNADYEIVFFTDYLKVANVLVPSVSENQVKNFNGSSIYIRKLK
jgi:predicted O-methyltransferase YrrM